jgi:iron-sulfur cluster assembly accessory protein
METQLLRPLEFTDRAWARVRTILSQPENVGKALRVLVLGGGCAGLQYSMALGFLKPDDFVLEKENYKVVVDPKSMQYLQGGQVDFYESIQSSGFKFDNPNATVSCGCGISFRTTHKDELTKTQPCH